jgi:hypothetical protein
MLAERFPAGRSLGESNHAKGPSGPGSEGLEFVWVTRSLEYSIRISSGISGGEFAKARDILKLGRAKQPGCSRA